MLVLLSDVPSFGFQAKGYSQWIGHAAQNDAEKYSSDHGCGQSGHLKH